eukprot:2626111-Amphidinium_carterae.1
MHGARLDNCGQNRLQHSVLCSAMIALQADFNTSWACTYTHGRVWVAVDAQVSMHSCVREVVLAL